MGWHGSPGSTTVGYEELVAFDSGALGMAYELGPTDGSRPARRRRSVVRGEGVEPAWATFPSLAVSREAPGTNRRSAGQAAGRPPELAGEQLPVFREAPEPDRARPGAIGRSCTGVMVIDAAIPIGRGQRELIVGDRNVGKTALALDIVAAQRAGDVACIYVVIGQPMSRVLSLREALLSERAALDNTASSLRTPAAPPGLQYLAPYAGATVAEWFRDQGHDALSSMTT